MSFEEEPGVGDPRWQERFIAIRVCLCSYPGSDLGHCVIFQPPELNKLNPDRRVRLGDVIVQAPGEYLRHDASKCHVGMSPHSPTFPTPACPYIGGQRKWTANVPDIRPGPVNSYG